MGPTVGAVEEMVVDYQMAYQGRQRPDAAVPNSTSPPARIKVLSFSPWVPQKAQAHAQWLRPGRAGRAQRNLHHPDGLRQNAVRASIRASRPPTATRDIAGGPGQGR
ncbi:hypothetical protein ACU4GD_06265 [Cupriavidus basilensis]